MFDTISELDMFGSILRVKGFVIVGFSDKRFRALCFITTSVSGDVSTMNYTRLSASVMVDTNNGRVELGEAMERAKFALMQEVGDFMACTDPLEDEGMYILHDTIEKTVKLKRASRREIDPVDIRINADQPTNNRERSLVN